VPQNRLPLQWSNRINRQQNGRNSRRPRRGLEPGEPPFREPRGTSGNLKGAFRERLITCLATPDLAPRLIWRLLAGVRQQLPGAACGGTRSKGAAGRL